MTAEAGGFKGLEYDYTDEIDNQYGRLETRRYWISADLRTLPNTERRKGLRSIGMAERESLKAGRQTVERRYFLNSIPANARLFAAAVRGHWGIEKRLHWRLDGQRSRKIQALSATATLRPL